MRGHYNQIALLLFGCVDDSLPGIIVAFADSLHLHARRLCELLDGGEPFVGEFDGFRVYDTGEVLGNETA